MASKKEQRELAKEHIEFLFEEAEKRPDRGGRYVKMARKIAMKFRMPLPAKFKRRFCKHCYSYFIPGENVRVRLREGKKVYFCLNCRKHTRVPYK